MSLRFRLVALIVALVALVSVALSGFELDTLLELLSAEALERSQLASQQVYASLIEHMNPQSVTSKDAAETQVFKAGRPVQRVRVTVGGAERDPMARPLLERGLEGIVMAVGIVGKLLESAIAVHAESARANDGIRDGVRGDHRKSSS